MESPNKEAKRRGFSRGTVVRCRDGSVGQIVRFNGGTNFCPFVLLELSTGQRVSRPINALHILQERASDDSTDRMEELHAKGREISNGGYDYAFQKLDTEDSRFRIKHWLGTIRKRGKGLEVLGTEEFKEILQDSLLELSKAKLADGMEKRLETWLFHLIEELSCVFTEWQEDEFVKSRFQLLRCLHIGRTTDIWLARKVRNGKKVVLKHYAIRDDAIFEHMCLKILSEKSTEYFPKCRPKLHVTPFEGRLVVIEYVKGKTFAPNSVEELRQQLRSLLKALKVIHDEGLVHRDLKQDHILVQKSTATIILIDFGCMRRPCWCSPHDGSAYTGTFPYVAPEEVKGDLFTSAVDMWSLGIILAGVLLGPEEFYACIYKAGLKSLIEELKMRPPVSWRKKAKKRKETWDRKAWDLICKLLVVNPESRLTVDKAALHPFVTQS